MIETSGIIVCPAYSAVKTANLSGHSAGHSTIPRSHSLVESIAEVVRISLDPAPGLLKAARKRLPLQKSMKWRKWKPFIYLLISMLNLGTINIYMITCIIGLASLKSLKWRMVVGALFAILPAGLIDRKAVWGLYCMYAIVGLMQLELVGTARHFSTFPIFSSHVKTSII